MPFALIGSGEYLPAMKNIDRRLLALASGTPHVVCLPTAAGRDGPERIGYWSELGVWHFRTLGVDVEALPVIDRKSACDPELAAAVTRANVVYLSGGHPDYLHVTLRKTPVWEAVLDVVERGGVLAGCSAGAMVQGESFIGLRGRQPGFGLLPGITVVPHYDELSGVMRRLLRAVSPRRLALIGIDGDTALVRIGEEYRVLGRGRVTVWHRGLRTIYGDGTRLTSDTLLGELSR